MTLDDVSRRGTLKEGCPQVFSDWEVYVMSKFIDSVRHMVTNTIDVIKWILVAIVVVGSVVVAIAVVVGYAFLYN